MALTLVALPLPADAAQQEALQKMFDSQGYLILKEMVAAKCLVNQAKAMEYLCYTHISDENKAALNGYLEKSKIYAALLDLLDDFELKKEEWVMVKVETRR